MYNEKIIEILSKKENGVNSIYEDYLERCKRNTFDLISHYTVYGIIWGLYACGEIDKELRKKATDELIQIDKTPEK